MYNVHVCTYLHKYAKKWYVYDLSQAMLKRGRANRKELGFKNEIESNKIEFHQGDMTEIKWNKKKFDIVLFINSLHFTNNPKLAFEEAHRVMNEGGLLLVQEPQDNFLPGSRLNKGTPDFDEESYKKKFAKLSRTENYLNNQKLFTLVERIKDSKKNINFWIFKK